LRRLCEVRAVVDNKLSNIAESAATQMAAAAFPIVSSAERSAIGSPMGALTRSTHVARHAARSGDRISVPVAESLREAAFSRGGFSLHSDCANETPPI
jgi:hypothetical protein